MGMTLSPCLDLLSVFAAASTQSWGLIILIAFLMAFITLSIMIALVWITMRGLAKLKLGWIERYEGVIVGVVLILLGGLQFVLR